MLCQKPGSLSMKQPKALFICILLVSARRLISAQSSGTAYLALFILPKYTCSGALENTPVINFKTPLIKQLKHGHKNSLRKTLTFPFFLHSPSSCLPAPDQNIRTCWVKAGMAEACPVERCKSSRAIQGRRKTRKRKDTVRFRYQQDG